VGGLADRLAEVVVCPYGGEQPGDGPYWISLRHGRTRPSRPDVVTLATTAPDRSVILVTQHFVSSWADPVVLVAAQAVLGHG
jgi:hypothetical protein